jgi:hypothetical protein
LTTLARLFKSLLIDFAPVVLATNIEPGYGMERDRVWIIRTPTDSNTALRAQSSGS